MTKEIVTNCSRCGSPAICASEDWSFWKCMNCGMTSGGFQLQDPLNLLSIKINDLEKKKKVWRALLPKAMTMRDKLEGW